MSVSSISSKRKRGTNSHGPLDLERKVKAAGGDGSYGLELCSTTVNNDDGHSAYNDSSIYGGRRSTASRSAGMSRSFRQQTNQSRMLRPSTAQSLAQSSYRQPSTKSRLKLPSASTRSARTRSSHSRKSNDNAAFHIVCAVGENLARETCVASIDAGSPISLSVTKQGNGQTYAETIAYLEMLQPHEVLLNEGRKNSYLAKKVLELFSTKNSLGNTDDMYVGQQDNETEQQSSGPCKTATVVKFISRACFDQTKGATLLRRAARKDTYDATLLEEFILLSSSHAVLHYTQHALGASFARNCLDIVINSGGKNRMAIDRATVMQLELLANAKTGKTRNTLIASIDRTRTTLGSRLLRTNLLAPPCRIDTVNARLELVDTFLQDEEFFYSVLEHLEGLPAIDKMLTNIAIVPKKNLTGENKAASARLASKGISALVCIKSTLAALPALAGVLKDHIKCLEQGQNQGEPSSNNGGDASISSKSGLLTGLGTGPYCSGEQQSNHLLKAIMYAISRPELSEVRQKLDDVFTPSTTVTKNANARCHQECFALKSSDDGLMTLTRKSYLGNVDDIYKKADEYAELHNIHVSVKYSASRGYYLSVPENVAAELPDVFIQPVKVGRFIHCTTEQVYSLNGRAQDNVQDLLAMTHERIFEVLEFARSKYDALASLADAVALLDLCHSFADNVTLLKSHPWCRPVVTSPDDGNNDPDSVTLTIRNGRYGIDVEGSFLASAEGPSELIPNDTFAQGGQCFTVITGINGSGKSTYLKQIGIIALLAHCGSYVPAEYASIPLRTRLCARMGTSDDQENNISSFMLEMNETAFLCNNSSNGSLILIDELGRATGNQDGLAIAWAVAEFLLSKQAMTFFVTHYPQLCKLGDVYQSVQNMHLQAALPTDENDEIRYTHKVGLGPCKQTPSYGIDMATSCGWPRDTINEARQLEANLHTWLDQHSLCMAGSEQLKEMSGPERSATKKLKELSKKLSRSANGTGSSIASLRSFLQNTLESSKASYSSQSWGNILQGTGDTAATSSDDHQENSPEADAQEKSIDGDNPSQKEDQLLDDEMAHGDSRSAMKLVRTRDDGYSNPSFRARARRHERNERWDISSAEDSSSLSSSDDSLSDDE